MRSRKRNWILKRMVLGFAVAGLVAPAAAQARVDEGIAGQPNSVKEVAVVVDYGAIETARLQPRSAAAKPDIELVRLNPRSTTLRSSDLIEQVRLAPKGGATQFVSSPGFNWGDAGIGAILALALLGFGVAGYRATRHLGKPQTA